MKKYNSHDIDYIKSFFNINDTYSRKFLYVLNRKDRNNIRKELEYFRDIYDLPDNILIECLINKYIKIKLYGVQFTNIKKNVNQHYEMLSLIQECEELGINYNTFF